MVVMIKQLVKRLFNIVYKSGKFLNDGVDSWLFSFFFLFTSVPKYINIFFLIFTKNTNEKLFKRETNDPIYLQNNKKIHDIQHQTTTSELQAPELGLTRTEYGRVKTA